MQAESLFAREIFMKMRKILIGAGMLSLLLFAFQAWQYTTPATGRWLAGDFHNHTLLTDGDIAAGEVFSQAFCHGLDWIANSEHGGAFERTSKGLPWPADTAFLGAPPEGKMWRWQSLWQYSFPIVKEVRTTYPDKLVVQGYEWNVPTHDHASVGIVGPEEDGGRAIARHDYLFDGEDSGTGADALLDVSNKSTTNSHAKAVAGVRWLADNYPASSYVILNHPSRTLGFSVADLRDLNDAAPRVAFGFEGIPGHQRAEIRGGYDRGPFHDAAGLEITARAHTYGGADFMVAKVGGVWDALLGEGRRFFTFTNSDFHSPSYDFWPGEFAKNHTYVQDANHDGKHSPAELLAGLRSGNSFIALGDLVNGLEFSAQSGRSKAEMGSTLATGQGSEVEILIRFRSPVVNNNGDKPIVDHIDLITGEVHGKIGKYLADGTTSNPAYANDSNETAQVIATFMAKDWRDDGDGWHTIVYRLPKLQRDMYCRLRGTNLGLDIPNQTDKPGNPLDDVLMAPNSALKAYEDLWFYSNPIFVTVSR